MRPLNVDVHTATLLIMACCTYIFDSVNTTISKLLLPPKRSHTISITVATTEQPLRSPESYTSLVTINDITALLKQVISLHGTAMSINSGTYCSLIMGALII